MPAFLLLQSTDKGGEFPFQLCCDALGQSTSQLHLIKQKRREVAHARHTEVIASCSELLSLHCPWHPLLLALLPALAGAINFPAALN
jgi:hypothetical protein